MRGHTPCKLIHIDVRIRKRDNVSNGEDEELRQLGDRGDDARQENGGAHAIVYRCERDERKVHSS